MECFSKSYDEEICLIIPRGAAGDQITGAGSWAGPAPTGGYGFHNNFFEKLSPGPENNLQDTPRDSLQSALKPMC